MKDSTAFPNPAVYLNYLSTEEATQFEVTRNLYLVIIGVCLAANNHLLTHKEYISGCYLGCSSLHPRRCPNCVQVFQCSFLLLHILKVNCKFCRCMRSMTSNTSKGSFRSPRHSSWSFFKVYIYSVLLASFISLTTKTSQPIRYHSVKQFHSLCKFPVF